MRRLGLAGILCAAPLSAQLPSPPPGEYVCTQSYISASGVSPTGRGIGTTVMTAPGGFGNLVIDRVGTYRMTGNRSQRATYAFEPASGRVVFSGILGALGNTYGTRGRNIFFDFTSKSIAFSCALQTATDYGQMAGGRTGENGAAAPATSRVALAGTLFFSSTDGIVKLNLADGTRSVLSTAFQFDIRGTEVVFVTSQNGVAITTTEGMGTRPVPVYGSSNKSPRFSPDGQRIALLGTMPPTSVEDAALAAHTDATVQPLIVGRDGRVQLALGSGYTQPSWTPDGRIVVAGTKAIGSLAGGAQSGIFITTGRGSSLRRIDPDFDAPHSPAVSPDGSMIAFVNASRIWVMPLAGGAPRTLFEGSGPFLSALAWSPDARSVAFADNQVMKTVSLQGVVSPVQDRNGFGVQTSGTIVWR